MELTAADIARLLPKRDENAHKGNFGRILLLCGSLGYTGAAYFAAMGALRSGAGLVYLGVPERIYAIEAAKLNEPVIFPLPDQGGRLDREAIPEILEKLPLLLHLNEAETEEMYDLAARSRHTVSADLPEYIMEKDIVRAALRTAKKHNVTDKQWEDFIRRITKESD